ncbi:MAG: TolC family protein [Acidobacteriota bacterium]|nr:TolC family protein [Acidobacteriota bacterium]
MNFGSRYMGRTLAGLLLALPLGAQQIDSGFPKGAITVPLPAPPLDPAKPTVALPLKPGGQEKSETLESLLKLAEENNPTLVQAAAQVRGEEGQARQAGLWFNPEVRYEGNSIGVHPEGKEAGLGHTAGDFQGLNFEQRVVTAGKLRLSREKYQARAEDAKEVQKIQKLQVSNEVRIRYYEALAKSRLFDIHGEMLKAMEDHWLTTKEMFNEGQANEVEFRQSKVALERQRLRTKMAENSYRASVERLGAVVGVILSSSRITGSLEGDANLIDFGPALSRILAQSPELAEAKAILKSHEFRLKREKVQPVPDLYFSGGYGYDFQWRQPVFNAGLRFSLPIFDRNQGTVQTAEADLLRQQKEVRRVELDLRQRFASEYENYLTALQHVQEYESTILPEARQAYETQLKSYKIAREDWPAVLAVEGQYQQRRETYVQSLLEWRKAETAINGFLLVGGGLKASMGVTPPGAGALDATSKPR